MASVSDLPAVLLAAMRAARTYPHPVGAIEHLETHISHVFLAGDYAYKLKKPVNFGFLDFTTLARRRTACHDEVRLNRRLAPDIYLDVVTLCADTNGYRLTPDSTTVPNTECEVAVRMRRMPQDGLLDRLAQTGDLHAAHLSNIARQLANFHASAARGPDVARYGDVENIRAAALQNFEQTAPFVGTVFPPAQHAAVRLTTEHFLDNHAALFAERVAARRIVDGHGDLHLRNMCLVAGRVVIFDCIEFNPALRAGDVMNDIAFLTMDLAHRELPELGNVFLNEYLEQTGDYAGLPLLDFYQAYRACVRAKVSCFEIAQDPSLAVEAARYLELAERCFAPRRGGLLITCGVSGSGKSTVARLAARTLNAVMVRSDAVRKQLAGVALTQRGGADLYAPAMTTRTYATLHTHARAIVASGRWAIVDAVHAYHHERQAAAALARELNVPFGILYCTAPHGELTHRLQQRALAANDVSDAGVAVLEQQLEFFEPPADSEVSILPCPGGELAPGQLKEYLEG